MRTNPFVYSMENKIFLSLHFIKSTSCQDLFGRYIVFNLAPIFYLKVTTTRKKRQVVIYNYLKIAKRVRHA